MAAQIIKVLWNRGLGVIARDEPGARNDLFFHRSKVAEDGFDSPRAGQRVSFGEEPDPQDRNRQRAIDARPTDGGEDATAGATPDR